MVTTAKDGHIKTILIFVALGFMVQNTLAAPRPNLVRSQSRPAFGAPKKLNARQTFWRKVGQKVNRRLSGFGKLTRTFLQRVSHKINRRFPKPWQRAVIFGVPAGIGLFVGAVALKRFLDYKKCRASALAKKEIAVWTKFHGEETVGRNAIDAAQAQEFIKLQQDFLAGKLAINDKVKAIFKSLADIAEGEGSLAEKLDKLAQVQASDTSFSNKDKAEFQKTRENTASQLVEQEFRVIQGASTYDERINKLGNICLPAWLSTGKRAELEDYRQRIASYAFSGKIWSLNSYDGTLEETMRALDKLTMPDWYSLERYKHETAELRITWATNICQGAVRKIMSSENLLEAKFRQLETLPIKEWMFPDDNTQLKFNTFRDKEVVRAISNDICLKYQRAGSTGGLTTQDREDFGKLTQSLPMWLSEQSRQEITAYIETKQIELDRSLREKEILAVEDLDYNQIVFGR